MPIEFAPAISFNSEKELLNDFKERILGFSRSDSVYISYFSSLSDFADDEAVEGMIEKISDIYGIEVADMDSDNIYRILEKIMNRYKRASPSKQ